MNGFLLILENHLNCHVVEAWFREAILDLGDIIINRICTNNFDLLPVKLDGYFFVTNIFLQNEYVIAYKQMSMFATYYKELSLANLAIYEQANARLSRNASWDSSAINWHCNKSISMHY